jgi:PIN domain nuclease of toxin-antitoxin system
VSDRRVVLDASAVIAWASRERGAETIGRLLPHAVVAAPNLTESLFRARVRGHGMTPDQMRSHVLGIGAEVEPFTEEDSAQAADLLLYSLAHPGPQGQRLSLGDACCIAVAERLRLPIVGDDQLWALLPLEVQFHAFR